jgi:hypothetical protein
VSSSGPHLMSYDLDVSLVYTSVSPEKVIIQVQVIISSP